MNAIFKWEVPCTIKSAYKKWITISIIPDEFSHLFCIHSCMMIQSGCWLSSGWWHIYIHLRAGWRSWKLLHHRTGVTEHNSYEKRPGNFYNLSRYHPCLFTCQKQHGFSNILRLDQLSHRDKRNNHFFKILIYPSCLSRPRGNTINGYSIFCNLKGDTAG